VAYARTLGVRIGEDCRLIGFKRPVFGTEPYLIKIGNHVTVAAGVRFITHDGAVWVFRREHPGIDIFGPIIIGNNVFIGINAIILPGVTIGDNCVIAAGSVVTQDIPANHIAAGVPARPLKTLDEYWAANQHKTMNIRQLPPQEKRRLLEEKFWGRDA
jgi:acetyltransferase-like isoleucine patch superfamily enzyme